MRKKGLVGWVGLVGFLLLLVVSGFSRTGIGQEMPPPVATFSILGFDPKTGEVGGAVQSRVFAVGNGVLWAEAGTGVVTTQAKCWLRISRTWAQRSASGLLKALGMTLLIRSLDLRELNGHGGRPSMKRLPFVKQNRYPGHRRR